MQLYAWAGQRSAALHQYRECVQALDQELGVSPLVETTQLYQAIKENRHLPPPVPFPPSQNAQGIAGTTLSVASKSAPPEDVVGATLAVALKSTPSIKLTLDSSPTPPPQPPLAVSGYPLVGRARASGNLERALELTQSALALCVYQGDRHREAALHSNLADLLHALGRSEEAMSHLKQSVSIYAEIGAEAGTLQPEIWKLVEW